MRAAAGFARHDGAKETKNVSRPRRDPRDGKLYSSFEEFSISLAASELGSLMNVLEYWTRAMQVDGVESSSSPSSLPPQHGGTSVLKKVSKKGSDKDTTRGRLSTASSSSDTKAKLLRGPSQTKYNTRSGILHLNEARIHGDSSFLVGADTSSMFATPEILSGADIGEPGMPVLGTKGSGSGAGSNVAEQVLYLPPVVFDKAGPPEMQARLNLVSGMYNSGSSSDPDQMWTTTTEEEMTGGGAQAKAFNHQRALTMEEKQKAESSSPGEHEETNLVDARSRANSSKFSAFSAGSFVDLTEEGVTEPELREEKELKDTTRPPSGPSAGGGRDTTRPTNGHSSGGGGGAYLFLPAESEDEDFSETVFYPDEMLDEGEIEVPGVAYQLDESPPIVVTTQRSRVQKVARIAAQVAEGEEEKGIFEEANREDVEVLEGKKVVQLQGGKLQLVPDTSSRIMDKDKEAFSSSRTASPETDHGYATQKKMSTTSILSTSTTGPPGDSNPTSSRTNAKGKVVLPSRKRRTSSVHTATSAVVEQGEVEPDHPYHPSPSPHHGRARPIFSFSDSSGIGLGVVVGVDPPASATVVLGVGEKVEPPGVGPVGTSSSSPEEDENPGGLSLKRKKVMPITAAAAPVPAVAVVLGSTTTTTSQQEEYHLLPEELTQVEHCKEEDDHLPALISSFRPEARSRGASSNFLLSPTGASTSDGASSLEVRRSVFHDMLAEASEANQLLRSCISATSRGRGKNVDTSKGSNIFDNRDRTRSRSRGGGGEHTRTTKDDHDDRGPGGLQVQQENTKTRSSSSRSRERNIFSKSTDRSGRCLSNSGTPHSLGGQDGWGARPEQSGFGSGAARFSDEKRKRLLQYHHGRERATSTSTATSSPRYVRDHQKKGDEKRGDLIRSILGAGGSGAGSCSSRNTTTANHGNIKMNINNMITGSCREMLVAETMRNHMLNRNHILLHGRGGPSSSRCRPRSTSNTTAATTTPATTTATTTNLKRATTDNEIEDRQLLPPYQLVSACPSPLDTPGSAETGTSRLLVMGPDLLDCLRARTPVTPMNVDPAVGSARNNGHITRNSGHTKRGGQKSQGENNKKSIVPDRDLLECPQTVKYSKTASMYAKEIQKRKSLLSEYKKKVGR
ncbi:unnamed protein product [Amoebophrya sp. A25]|nr:unnamed protein product [Amoebophrya sp. A25]|eukprot:GSA25T00023741001.1